MSETPVPACGVCSERVPIGRRLYCSPGCRETAKKRRQRARRSGADVPAPTVAARRALLSELADGIRQTDPKREEELMASLGEAQERITQLVADLGAANAALATARKSLTGATREKTESLQQTRFLALAFARTIRANNLQGTMPASLRDRIAQWIPSEEDPWA